MIERWPGPTLEALRVARRCRRSKCYAILGESAYKTFIVMHVHEVVDKPFDSIKPWGQNLPEKTV